jgi:hypothetical protein
MNWFSPRGKKKVNIQWLPYCMARNMGKCMPKKAAEGSLSPPKNNNSTSSLCAEPPVLHYIFIIKYINEVNNDPTIITITIWGIVFVWYDLFLYLSFPSVPGMIINFGVIVQNIK